MNEVLKAMKERRSVRKFKPDMPKKEDIDSIIEAGLYAPSGMNRQSAIIVAVTNKELRNVKMKGIVFRNINYNADVKGRIASVIRPSGIEKIRLWFFRLFKQLLPFGCLDGKLENPAVNGNEIEVTFDNVTANGVKLGRFNFGLFFKTSGNEDLRFS